jgi:hypothetical protein
MAVLVGCKPNNCIDGRKRNHYVRPSIQMFGLIMINEEVKGIIMLGHQYKCLV